MSGLYLGTNKIKKIYLGNTKLRSIYLGASKVWSGASMITYVSNGVSTVVEVPEGENALSMIPTKAGHTFKGWTLTESVLSTPLTSYIADGESHTLYALWSANDVSLSNSGCGTFSTNAFDHSVTDNTKYYYDNVISITDLAKLQNLWKYFKIQGSAYVSDGYGTANLYLEQGNTAIHGDTVRRAFSANGTTASPYSTFRTSPQTGYSYKSSLGLYLKDFDVTVKTTGIYTGMWFESRLKNDSTYSGYQSATKGFLRTVTLTNNGEITSVG